MPEGQLARAMSPRDVSFVSRLKQQKLSAWYPKFRTRSTGSGLVCAGGLFIALSLWLLETSSDIWEVRVEYSKVKGLSEDKAGSIEVEVKHDMPNPVYIYYELQGFYQNHRRYVSSRDDQQLLGVEPDDPVKNDHRLCSPWILSEDGRVNYPCGLIARSVFNDTFVIQYQTKGSSEWLNLRIDNSPKAIAWQTDIDAKFKNVDPEEKVKTREGDTAQRQALVDMWILKRFPPVQCVQVNISDSKPYVPVYVAEKSVAGKSGKQVTVADCENYMSSKAECRFTKRGEAFDCVESAGYKKVREAWGVESGHFITWMRYAGMPNFKKIWGRVDEPIKAGTKLKLSFVSNFPVEPFDGKKFIVLSTANQIVGGKDGYLGWAYMSVAVASIGIGVFQFMGFSPQS